MGLGFQTAIVAIPRTEGVFTSNEDVSFGRIVRTADVALKAFKLDFTERPASLNDIVQVDVGLQNIGDEAVEFKVKTNYSGAEYQGEVSVLIIAELD